MPILNLKHETLPENDSITKDKSGIKKTAPQIGRMIGKENKRNWKLG